VDPKDIVRFKDLEVIGIPQPFWFGKGEYYEKIALPYLGKMRADKQYPMKSLINVGARLASASDFPVTYPCPPLLGIMTGITRCEPGITDPDEVLWPAESLNLAEMIESFTFNGAYANFLENEIGSIEVGKLADLVVLDRNLFDIPVEQIEEVNVLMTIFEGGEVYRD
jgi:predicted amidohydrolase YtcJ